MPTRAELRSMVRLRLEDTSPTPLWDDATLNDALGAAIEAYSARMPVEKALSVAIATGATSVPLVVAGSPLEARQAIAVLDTSGVAVHRTRGAGGDPTGPASWRLWAGALVLSRPLASAATWTVRYLASRTLPTDDVTAVEVVPGDAPIVVSIAAATLLRRRWQLTLLARDQVVERNGAQHTRTGREIVADLWDAWQSGGTVTLRDLDYDAAPVERTVRIVGLVEETPRADAASQVSLTLVEL